MASFELQWQSWVAVIETVCHIKPKIFTVLLFTEKYANSCYNEIVAAVLGVEYKLKQWEIPRITKCISFLGLP